MCDDFRADAHARTRRKGGVVIEPGNEAAELLDSLRRDDRAVVLALLQVARELRSLVELGEGLVDELRQARS